MYTSYYAFKAIIACCSLFLADNFDLVIAAHEISCNTTANVLSLRFLLGLLLVVWYTVTKASPRIFSVWWIDVKEGF